MKRNLDEELKMANIRKTEQMIAESFATVEKCARTVGVPMRGGSGNRKRSKMNNCKEKVNCAL